MSWYLVASHSASMTVVLTCWWLTHQFAWMRPPGRMTAVLFAVLGFISLYIMVARTYGADLSYASLIFKIVLAWSLILSGRRQFRRGNK